MEPITVLFSVCASHNEEQNNKELPYINDEIPITEQKSVDVGFNIESNTDEGDSMESMLSYIHLNGANETLDQNVSDIEFTDSTNDSLNDNSNNTVRNQFYQQKVWIMKISLTTKRIRQPMLRFALYPYWNDQPTRL